MAKKKSTKSNAAPKNSNEEFTALLDYIHGLADNKLGYPVSLLTYIGAVSNQSLGIQQGTLANILLNNVGDPFIDSQTSLMEVKKHERLLIKILEKFYGLQENSARGYVTTGGTEGNFAAMWWAKRYMINSCVAKLIENDSIIKSLFIEERKLVAALTKIPLNSYQERAEHLTKILELKSKLAAAKDVSQQLLTPTVFFAKDSTHYSIPKISEILKLNIRTISTLPDGQIDLKNLQKELILHSAAHPHSSVILIANIGTTVTGAIDDVPKMKEIVESIPKIPNYTIHIDGALTGFVLPIIKPFGSIENYFDAIGVNSLVFSAHKYLGMSQPCGIIVAKRNFFEKAFETRECSIDYVGNIRDVTITGSRSGLNVLMFYNALKHLGLPETTDKLTAMVNDNIETANYLAAELGKIYGTEKVYHPHQFNVLFPKPSMEMARKYQLMLTGDTATVCILANVTKDLIDTFITDLKKDRRKTMKPSSNIKIENLTEEYLKEATELFVDSFCGSEPITKYLDISKDDYRPFAREVTAKACKEGLSKIALNDKNEIIGLVIAEDYANKFEVDLEKYPKLKPIYQLLDKLSESFVEGKEFQQGKILHTWIGAIRDDYRAKGMFRDLAMVHVESAMKKGFHFIYSDFTNEISAKVVKQFEVLRLCNKINYKDFEINGQKPFPELEGSAMAYVTPLRADIKLDTLEECYTTAKSK